MISKNSAPLNAHVAIGDNLDADSNRTEENDPDSDKHPSLQTSTEAGTIISIQPVLFSAHHSIHDNLDPDSNITEEHDSPSRKQFSPKNAIESGMLKN
jgi:hypothetical protein